MPPKNIKLQNMPKKCHRKAQNRDITHFLNKTAKSLAKILFSQTFFACLYVFTSLPPWLWAVPVSSHQCLELFPPSRKYFLLNSLEVGICTELLDWSLWKRIEPLCQPSPEENLRSRNKTDTILWESLSVSEISILWKFQPFLFGAFLRTEPKSP